MDSILLTLAAVLLLSLDHSTGSPLPNDIHNFVPLREYISPKRHLRYFLVLFVSCAERNTLNSSFMFVVNVYISSYYVQFQQLFLVNFM